MICKSDLKLFHGYVKSLTGTMSIFGYNELAKALIKKFPGRFANVVSVDENVIGKQDTVPVISIAQFEQNPTENVVIVDENRKYDYLEVIYKVMFKKNMDLLSGIKIRYKYSYYTPQKFDFDYIQTRNRLPMEFTIPHDSAVRLIDGVKATGSLEGDILELGTGYGGSTYLIADAVKKYNLNKTIYTIDRFRDANYLPDLSFETVCHHLKHFPNVVVLPGEFKEQLEKLDISKISFCFFDAYATPGVLKYIYPKMVRSGILLVDNYMHGCDLNWGKPMADLFFEDKPEKIIRIGGAQGLVVMQ
jgi:predicted O-methyltransferase YrrM